MGTGYFPYVAPKALVGEIEILYESWKVQLNFPMKGLAGIVKKNFPMSGGAANGEIFFLLWLLSLEWGNLIVPWMMNREFYPSPFFKMMGLTFLFTYWKLFKKYLKPCLPKKQRKFLCKESDIIDSSISNKSKICKND